MTRPSAVPARFITFEGIDGCGKSTLLDRLSLWLRERHIAHITTREPGGTALGESIRQLLLAPSTKDISRDTEVLLYTASRAQLVHEVILPALNSGTWVLSDRYADATLAYQGFARGLELERLRELQQWSTRGLTPHRTILLDCPVAIALKRIQTREGVMDRIEMESVLFHERVRQGYLQLAGAEPRRFLVIDGSRPLDLVLEHFQNEFLKPLEMALEEG